MSHIASQLESIRERMRSACFRAGRDCSEVKLVAVSKTFPVEDIREAFDSAQILFGESRLQEATQKIGELPFEIEWHFIGRVQRNKVRKILPLFPWVHAVDSLKLAVHIDSVAQELGLVPKIFLQVNQAGEETKGGFDLQALADVMPTIQSLKHVEVVGLMAIPPAVENPEDSRKWFTHLRQLRDDLRKQFDAGLPMLSMGMSEDFEIAIEEGATHVRVGSAIFGKRDGKIEGELG